MPFENPEAEWEALLTGHHPGMLQLRRHFRSLPSSPRCKMCYAPFKGAGGIVLRPWFGPWERNAQLCKSCMKGLAKFGVSGAEVEISMLFADVRGSTSLAEHMSAQDFSNVIARFYGTAAKVVDEWNGLVDKFVGDEVVALFIPGFAGEDHAARAVNAARDLMRATGNDGDDPWVAVGAGVHTGIPYVGRVGEGDACDFTAVGDAVNTTARLAMNAGAGEILVSASTAKASGLDTSALEMRTLSLRGREEVTEVWVAAA